MQKLLLGSIAVTALAAAGIALAQPATPAPGIQSTSPYRPSEARQPQTRNGMVDKVRQHFARLDTDRDGYLTKAEAETGHSGMKAHRGQHAARGAGGQRDHGAMFDRLDGNRDGAISRQEFDSAHQQRQAMRVDRNGDGRPDQRMGGEHRGKSGMRLGGRMFDQADANHDSRVSLQEATGAALRHFDMADVNRDGTISPQEHQQMRSRMMEMHRATRAS